MIGESFWELFPIELGIMEKKASGEWKWLQPAVYFHDEWKKRLKEMAESSSRSQAASIEQEQQRTEKSISIATQISDTEQKLNTINEQLEQKISDTEANKLNEQKQSLETKLSTLRSQQTVDTTKIGMYLSTIKKILAEYVHRIMFRFESHIR